ncbi:hypothetical protein [Stenoxybacter acetivorans]|uniref:hypothetical protein n=1 Tax=Stenoxybacter acetivorans TaxID=422441 RepID=UPI00055CDAD1|nr:hypothetical protein [Stenoxybacter acetivorans]
MFTFLKKPLMIFLFFYFIANSLRAEVVLGFGIIPQPICNSVKMPPAYASAEFSLLRENFMRKSLIFIRENNALDYLFEQEYSRKLNGRDKFKIIDSNFDYKDSMSNSLISLQYCSIFLENSYLNIISYVIKNQNDINLKDSPFDIAQYFLKIGNELYPDYRYDKGELIFLIADILKDKPRERDYLLINIIK